MIDSDLKKAIRKRMEAYQTKEGWRKGDDDKLEELLPEIWNDLLNSGLITKYVKQGFSYLDFREVAIRTRILIDAGLM